MYPSFDVGEVTNYKSHLVMNAGKLNQPLLYSFVLACWFVMRAGLLYAILLARLLSTILISTLCAFSSE